MAFAEFTARFSFNRATLSYADPTSGHHDGLRQFTDTAPVLTWSEDSDDGGGFTLPADRVDGGWVRMSITPKTIADLTSAATDAYIVRFAVDPTVGTPNNTISLGRPIRPWYKLVGASEVIFTLDENDFNEQRDDSLGGHAHNETGYFPGVLGWWNALTLQEKTEILAWGAAATYFEENITAPANDPYIPNGVVEAVGFDVQYSQTYTPTPIPVPAAPTGINFTAVTTSSMRLRWDAVSGATGYKLIFNPAGETSGNPPALNGELIDVGNVLFRDHTGLAANTPHFAQVLAYNSSGDGPRSAIATANTLAEDDPPDDGETPEGISPAFLGGWGNRRRQWE